MAKRNGVSHSRRRAVLAGAAGPIRFQIAQTAEFHRATPRDTTASAMESTGHRREMSIGHFYKVSFDVLTDSNAKRLLRL